MPHKERVLYRKDSFHDLTTAMNIGVLEGSIVASYDEGEMEFIADFGTVHRTRWQVAGQAFYLDSWEATWANTLSEAKLTKAASKST